MSVEYEVESANCALCQSAIEVDANAIRSRLKISASSWKKTTGCSAPINAGRLSGAIRIGYKRFRSRVASVEQAKLHAMSWG